jgi:hypothetical protein
MAKKSTDAEIQLRVNEIYNLIIEGNTYFEIVKYCKNNFNVSSTRTVSKYIKSAKEIIDKISLPEQEQARKEAIAHYKHLIQKAHQCGFLNEARLNQTRLDKINGIETENININDDRAITLDELKEQIIKVHKDAMKEKE